MIKITKKNEGSWLEDGYFKSADISMLDHGCGLSFAVTVVHVPKV